MLTTNPRKIPQPRMGRNTGTFFNRVDEKLRTATITVPVIVADLLPISSRASPMT